MTTKRQENSTGLKFKFIPQTNTKPSRYKVTQTNNNKSIFIDAQFNVEPLAHFVNIIDKLEEVESFSLLVDNTQNDYYLFILKTSGSSFEDLVSKLKD